jgi:hypothetical protein
VDSLPAGDYRNQLPTALFDFRSFDREDAMKLSALTAAIALCAGSTAPLAVYAAGQPQLSPQESTTATKGEPPAQAEKSKMEVKRQLDTRKYQGRNAKSANQQTGSGPVPSGKD